MKAYRIYSNEYGFFVPMLIVYHYSISNAIDVLENRMSCKVYDYHEESPNLFKISFQNEVVRYAKEIKIEPGLVVV